jgi:hypothetical protein
LGSGRARWSSLSIMRFQRGVGGVGSLITRGVRVYVGFGHVG